ncbi:MAG TPA: universal stress protein [Jatrophihabitans sp.]|nr:universal stress protein [Jatrophihabitans sp.]
MGFELGTDGPTRILVCIDGSAPSMRAGAYAAGLARRQRSDLVVAYVATSSALLAMAPDVAAAAHDTLDQIAAEIEATVELGTRWHGIEAKFFALRGDPFEEICRFAEQHRVEAVVVGASAQAGHRFVGSFAVRLVKAGRWPVTVVP